MLGRAPRPHGLFVTCFSLAQRPFGLDSFVMEVYCWAGSSCTLCAPSISCHCAVGGPPDELYLGGSPTPGSTEAHPADLGVEPKCCCISVFSNACGLCACCSRRLRRRNTNATITAMAARPATPTPAPIPACAPVDNPLELGEDVGVEVELVDVVDVILVLVIELDVEVEDEMLLLVVAVAAPTVVCSFSHRQSVI
jgi:hypothetical protein